MPVEKEKAAWNKRQKEMEMEKETRASSVVDQGTPHELLPQLRVTERDELSPELLELPPTVQENLDLRLAERGDVGLGLGTGLERRPLVCTRAADRLFVELGRGLSRTERPALGAGGSLVGEEGEHGGWDVGSGREVWGWCGGRGER